MRVLEPRMHMATSDCAGSAAAGVRVLIEARGL